MPTFTSPIPLSQFQLYLRDTSTDPTLLSFLQSLLDTATEKVYTWLDRDYTASALKTDVFWGNDTEWHAMRHPAATLISWTYTDADGTTSSPGVSDLILRAKGALVQSKSDYFSSNAEHRLTYQLSGSLVCPEAVRQVIVELAADLFTKSYQGDGSLGVLATTSSDAHSTERERLFDLTERHKEMLSPYRRIPI